jgi:hypothetical protein
LKKLENEKSRTLRASGMTNLSGGLFREERQRPHKRRIWKLTAVVAVAVLITFATTLFFMQHGSGFRKRGLRQDASVMPKQKTSTPSPVPQAPVQPVPVASPPAVPGEAQQSAAPVSTPVVEQAPPPTDGEEEDRSSRRRERRKSSPAIGNPIQPTQQGGPAPADIKLSGIAWQDARSGRRAVINGFLMREGGVVSGAKISEILPDRVRFTQSGRDFELSLVLSPSMQTQGK